MLIFAFLNRYEREEEFYSIPVTVKCRTLESSLEQFVNDEIMEGDNAYYCEKCRENVRFCHFNLFSADFQSADSDILLQTRHRTFLSLKFQCVPFRHPQKGFCFDSKHNMRSHWHTYRSQKN